VSSFPNSEADGHFLICVAPPGSSRDAVHNGVTGNFSLTLIDSLDTFVVLNDRTGFEDAVRKIIDWVSFDVNTKPQLFETNIRVLGGLLSGHLFASRTGPFQLPWYRGELLTMAHDLGQRFLPAFSTPTGLPFARVSDIGSFRSVHANENLQINLRHGVAEGETFDTCEFGKVNLVPVHARAGCFPSGTAGAGSLILEFATLSRLTGDPRFEKAAYKAFFALWNRRSEIGLVGNTINARTGVCALRFSQHSTALTS
jgi:ER degradation enhancer, mannosidase alpha-like 1